MKRKKIVNILLTAAGTMKGPTMIHYLKQQTKYNISITACDADGLSAGLYLADKHYLIPKVTDKNYIPALLEICRQEKIKIFIPLLSDELLLISKHKEDLSKLGVAVIVADPPCIETCEDKWLTYKLFNKLGVPTPKTWLTSMLPKKSHLPLVVKPRVGSGAKGFKLVENQTQLKQITKLENHIAQSLVEGKEYTTDFICDNKGHLIGAVTRIRLKVMEGKSVKGQTVNNPSIIKHIKKIAYATKMYGPANVQCFETKRGKLLFTEINPRLAAGGLPLSIVAGLNIPLLCLQLGLKHKIKTPIKIKPNIYMLRYLSEIFIDHNYHSLN